jgi:uncharacterized protein YodC (DUF2158 family)
MAELMDLGMYTCFWVDAESEKVRRRVEKTMAFITENSLVSYFVGSGTIPPPGFSFFHFNITYQRKNAPFIRRLQAANRQTKQ